MQNDIPEFLYNKLNKQYNTDLTNDIINSYKEERYLTFRVNTLKTTVFAVKKQLELNNIKYEEVSWYKEAFVIPNGDINEIKKLNMYINGEIYLQSLSSMIPPLILNPLEGDNILDMAASPGSKTTQISALTNNKSLITAVEKNRIRLERLKYNIEKLGAKKINILNIDATKLDDFYSFDKILLDAPCSGSGTLNIFDKNYTSFNEELIDRSSKIQYRLLKKAIKLLKSGHEMVYSTCSILKEENEDIINKILEEENVELIDIENNFSFETLPVSIKGTLCIKPNKYFEGFFVAKLRKK